MANGGATEEYQNPVNFFARTFVTEGLKQLLVSVANRLNARGGEPVIISSDVNGLRAVVDEVLSHLSGSGARVKVQLDIAAQNQNVFSPNLVRTVSENATALQFQRAEFN